MKRIYISCILSTLLCVSTFVNVVHAHAEDAPNYIIAKPTKYGKTGRVLSRTERVVIPKCDNASWVYRAKHNGKYTFTFGKLKGDSSIDIDWEMAERLKAKADEYGPTTGFIDGNDVAFYSELTDKSKRVITVILAKGDVLRVHYKDVSVKTRHTIKVEWNPNII